MLALDTSAADQAPRVALWRRCYRRAYWLRRDWPVMWQLGWSAVILHAAVGGIGDELLCSAAARELKRRGVRNIAMLARHPELFSLNSDVDRVLTNSEEVLVTAENWSLDLRRCCEWQHNDPFDADRQIAPRDHIIAENCRRAGVSGAVALRPYLHLTPAECAAGRRVDRQVAIHASGLGASYVFRNKEWGPSRMQAVVEALRPHFDFVQLGAPGDPPLSGACDLRGQTTPRESAAILSASKFFIGQVGFLMHLARAVDRPAVIIYGGREHPEQSGYPCNENLYRAVECAPCWRMNRCEVDRQCLTQVSIEDVTSAALRLATRVEDPLATTSLEL